MKIGEYMNNKNNNTKKHKSINKQKNSSRITKFNSDLNTKNLIHTRKLKITFAIIILIFITLLARLAYIQFVDGNHLKGLAYKQQTINQIISPKRGNIYDSTGKALAISAQVDTITINPTKIQAENDKKTSELKETVSKGLSDIFELDYNETFEKVNSNSQVETIIKKVEHSKVEELKNWMKENDISIGINIDEDTKRYYPYSTLASQVIGFCGSDNQGLTGIEYKWDSVLTGTPGKIVSSKDSLQQEIPNAEETYIAAENGSDLTLTIDVYIQTIVEKYLKQAVEDNACSKGGNVIVMDPHTGDILAMASYPDYDLNTPFTPNSSIASTYSNLTTEQKSTALQNMWKNKSVSELYEPGSVFKIITAAIAIEENITTTDKANDFICTGYENVADRNIACWRYYNPHGYQTLRQSLMNSCNPAFMQLGKRIGTTTLYKYYKAFGLFDKTGVALAGEENSIFHPLKDVGPVELATMSFGQRFSITPLQMITAVSCVANDGILVQPRIVKSITNTDTGAVSNIDTTNVRQVLSKETADQVKSMMESVVSNGTGKHGAVNGYSIGGKTGTSEPTENNSEDGYVASYVAISPVENTQVVLLLTLYDPSNGNYQGGQVAGPVVSQMLSEILPYLDVPSDSTETSFDSSDLITLPEIRNKTVAEAEKVLKNAGFNTIKISCSGDKNSTLVADQVPKPGIQLQESATIMIYSNNDTTRTSVTVPDLKGMSASQATNTLKSKNLNIRIDGTGSVITQDYSKDTQVEEGTVITVTLKNTLVDAH